MSILVPSDFIGRVAITQNKYDVADLQIYIDEVQTQYLDDLLGCELNALLQADLALAPVGEPTADRFKDIYNKFCNDIESNLCLHPLLFDWHQHFFQFFVVNQQNKSRGIKEMLKGFTYFEYVRDQANVNTSIGVAKSKGVASEVLPVNWTAVKREYNRSIVDYWNIQFFILDNETTYPEYNGLIKESASIL